MSGFAAPGWPQAVSVAFLPPGAAGSLLPSERAIRRPQPMAGTDVVWPVRALFGTLADGRGRGLRSVYPPPPRSMTWPYDGRRCQIVPGRVSEDLGWVPG